MIQDRLIQQAVSRILQRSERQTDAQKVVGTFVDVGILPQLDNRNNQVFYGRRGTGKTHVLKVLGTRLADRPDTKVVFLDARVLGSTNQFTDKAIPLPVRCLALFRDILGPIHDGLLEYIVDTQPNGADKALDLLNALADSCVERQYTVQEYTAEEVLKLAEQGELHAAAKSPFGELGGSIGDSSSGTTTVAKKYVLAQPDKIVFPDIQSLIAEVLDIANLDLWVLLDEWSALPIELQPYLAEFIKRTLVPTPRVVLKIGALEYRSKFFERFEAGVLGLELGADISTAPDLDDYYVFDRNPDEITKDFADMLLRHLNTELPDGYFAQQYGVTEPRHLGTKMFTQTPVLKELARAAEGVARDLINIFTKAYFHAQRRGNVSIDKAAVVEAAREWFEQDKARDLDDTMHAVLRTIVGEVIGRRSARSFLMERKLERHPLIQRLIDARVLHLVRRGYADKDNPGIRYNIYTLDYGTYVDLVNTSREPEGDFTEAPEGTDVSTIVVPFDDRRSIRRIILDERHLPAM